MTSVVVFLSFIDNGISPIMFLFFFSGIWPSKFRTTSELYSSKAIRNVTFIVVCAIPFKFDIWGKSSLLSC